MISRKYIVYFYRRPLSPVPAVFCLFLFFFFFNDTATTEIYTLSLHDALPIYDDSEIINIGTGEDLSIGDLAALIKGITSYDGEIVYDVTKPDGTPRKLLDVSKLNSLGWKAKTGLRDGIIVTYNWFVRHYGNGRLQ